MDIINDADLDKIIKDKKPKDICAGFEGCYIGKNKDKVLLIMSTEMFEAIKDCIHSHVEYLEKEYNAAYRL